ncbi:MAG: polysaccharide biosynthesis C-terminal domain-containing protein [Clostridiales bacterium]|nr:polysaccharide biosynthesis C-terminal domain-containing protein [Clostridiales bacterium]
MCAYLGGIYVAYKRTKSVGITTIVAAVCNLIVDIALINYIGLYAASGSTFVSYLFLLIFRMIDVRKIVKIRYPYMHLLLVFGIMIIECVLCFQKNFYLNCINFVVGVVAFCLLNRGLFKTVFLKGLKILKKAINKS